MTRMNETFSAKLFPEARANLIHIVNETFNIIFVLEQNLKEFGKELLLRVEILGVTTGRKRFTFT